MNATLLQGRAVAVFLIVAVNLFIYGQVTGFELINYDDPYFITLNSHVNTGLSWDNFLWSWQSRVLGIWHPLTWLSLQLETSVFGAENAGVRHTINLVLHIANCLLVYFIFRSLLQRNTVALVVALLFATHPQHVQVVAWVAERKELLAAFFFFLTLRFYVLWRFQNHHSAWYAAALISYLLAVLSKPSVVPLPLVLILIDWYFRERLPQKDRSPGKLLLNKVPFILLALAVAVIAIFLKNTGQTADYVHDLPLLKQLAMIPLSLSHYLVSTLIPQPYPFFIGAPDIITPYMLLQSFSVILVFAIGVWVFSRRQPLVAFGVLWFLLLWLPVSGIVTVSYYFIADRYTYLPHIGLFIAIVLALDSLLAALPGKRAWAIGLGAFTIISTTALATVQTSYWRDSIRLFERELALNPHSDVAAVHIGQALAETGNHQEAMPYYYRAIENDPDDYLGNAYLGYSLEALGREEEAIVAYRKAISTKSIRSNAHANLGALLAKKGRIDAGLEVLAQGLELFPDNMELLRHQAYWQGFGKQQIEQAVIGYTRVLQANPADAHTLQALVWLHGQAGEYDKAEAYLRRHMELQPEDRELQLMLRQLRENKP